MSFETIVHQQNEHPTILLKDNSTGTAVELYAFGSILNKFSVMHQGEELNIIDGYDSVEHAMQTIAPAFKSAKLSPFVCRTKNEKYHFGERSHRLTKYTMGKHAIHGLVYDAVFSIVETVSNEDEACVRMQHVYDNPDEGFPYAYRCAVEFTLKQKNELVIKTIITNIDDQLLPVADGLHPYFNLGNNVDECQLEFQSKEILEFDNELIPTGKLKRYEEFGSIKNLGNTSFDNCFTLNFAECQPMCVWRNPQKKIQLEIHPSHSYPYLQLYTPNDRKSIAIENLSAAPDALNNGIGLKVLEPHETATFITKFIIRPI